MLYAFILRQEDGRVAQGRDIFDGRPQGLREGRLAAAGGSKQEGAGRVLQEARRPGEISFC